MRLPFVIALLIFASLSTQASQIKTSGRVYICSNRESEVKVTVDLVSSVGQKMAVVSQIGAKDLFLESVNKQKKYLFLEQKQGSRFLALKNIKTGQIDLELVSDVSFPSQILQNTDELKIRKFKAVLSSRVSQVDRVLVDCLETNWRE